MLHIKSDESPVSKPITIKQKVSFKEFLRGLTDDQREKLIGFTQILEQLIKDSIK